MSRYARLSAGAILLPIVLVVGGCADSQETAPASEPSVSSSRLAASSERDWFRQLTTSDFDSVIQASRGPYVVLVRNQDCRPCDEMSRSIGATLENWLTPVSVGTVDTDSNSALLDQLGLSSVPTTLLYRDGVLVAQTTGSMSERRFTDWFRAQAS